WILRILVLRPGRGDAALVVAAGGLAVQNDLGVLEAVLLDEIVEDRRVLGREPHAAVRGRLAEILHFGGAVNGVPVLHEKDGMRHGGVVPLLAVPDLVHGRGGVGARRRRKSRPAGRNLPIVGFDTVDEDGHLLGRFVDIDDDLLGIVGQRLRAFLSRLTRLLVLGRLGSGLRPIGAGLRRALAVPGLSSALAGLSSARAGLSSALARPGLGCALTRAGRGRTLAWTWLRGIGVQLQLLSRRSAALGARRTGGRRGLALGLRACWSRERKDDKRDGEKAEGEVHMSEES